MAHHYSQSTQVTSNFNVQITHTTLDAQMTCDVDNCVDCA